MSKLIYQSDIKVNKKIEMKMGISPQDPYRLDQARQYLTH
jgi:hypothetical protein